MKNKLFKRCFITFFAFTICIAFIFAYYGELKNRVNALENDYPTLQTEYGMGGLNTSLTPFTNMGTPLTTAFGFVYGGNNYQYLAYDTFGTVQYYYVDICEKIGNDYEQIFRLYTSMPLALNFTDGKIYKVVIVAGAVTSTVVVADNSMSYLQTIIPHSVKIYFDNTYVRTGLPTYTKITLKTLTENNYNYLYKSNSTMAFLEYKLITAQMLSVAVQFNNYYSTMTETAYNNGYADGIAEDTTADYNKGYTDGQKSIKDMGGAITGFFPSLFGSISYFFVNTLGGISLFGISVLDIIIVMTVVSVALLLLKLFRG